MRQINSVLVVSIGLLIPATALAVSFQTAGPLEPGAAGSSTNAFDDKPRVVTDGAGHWVAVWETSEFASGPNPLYPNIAVSESSDNGATWTTPHLIMDDPTIDDVTPSLATDGNGLWVCAYTGQSITEPLHRVVKTSKSVDNGATWSTPVDVNPDDPMVPYNYTPSIASDGAGHWVVVWDTTYTQLANPTDGDHDIAVSTSTDGESWSAPARVNSESTTDIATDTTPRVASDGNGVWVCVWTSDNSRGLQGQGDKEIFFARSVNNGATWSAQAVLNSEFDTETGLDEDESLATDGNGNWIVTWEGAIGFGVYRIWTSTSTDDGVTWSTRKQVSDDPPLGDSVFPDVATDGNGKWILVWNRHLFQKAHSDYDIAKSESSNNGSTWSAVKNLNSNATADLGDDWNASIATDKSGHWVVLWQTEDTDNGDHDVWRSISNAEGPGTLTLTAPNGGEKWKIGKKKKIEWTSSGNVGSDVKLELLRNGSFVQNIKASTNNDGKQKWKLPNSLTPGKGYKVRITSKSDGAVTDTSDGSFKIKAAK